MPAVNILVALMLAVGWLLILVLMIPLLQGRVRMNAVYGARFPKSFTSDDNWYRINRYAALRMIIWTLPLLPLGVLALFLPFEEREWLVLPFALAPLIVLVPAVETYRYSLTLPAGPGARAVTDRGHTDKERPDRRW